MKENSCLHREEKAHKKGIVWDAGGKKVAKNREKSKSQTFMKNVSW